MHPVCLRAEYSIVSIEQASNQSTKKKIRNPSCSAHLCMKCLYNSTKLKSTYLTNTESFSYPVNLLFLKSLLT